MFYGPKGHPPELLRFSSVLQTAPSRQSKFLLHETFSAAQQWLEVFKHVDANMPVVWNSNSYYREETAKLLAGFVDIYLLDFKYGSEDVLKNFRTL